jgi:hypothetical protein
MRRGRGRRWVPAAIWEDKDKLALSCLVDGVERDPFEVWTWVCRYPVPYETYVAVAELGEAWPEDLPDLNKARSVSNSDPFHVSPSLEQITMGLPTATSFVSAPHSSHPTFGHNSSGVSEAEGFMEEIELLWQSAQEWLDVVQSPSSQSEADKAANYAERFGNLENRAEEARTFEKKPVLDLGRSIDAKWKPVISKASDGKVRMKKVLEPYLIGELKRQKALGIDGEPPRAGTMGRRIGLRSRMILKITSNEDLHHHYKADPRLWADKSLQDVIAKLAEIDLTAHKPIPGATLIEELTAA